MTYFHNIHSLAELKKQYRTLALANHPDKGGPMQTMQQINDEFARLYEVWKDDTSVSAGASGYEGDYAGATAQQYAECVYNEYRWMGSNYNGQQVPEVVELVRRWLKETYPRYKFSVRRSDYDLIHISLMQADFEAFTAASGVKTYANINHYRIDSETELTDRAREVMANVCAFVQSYNFDDCDPMTDYFHMNFCLNLSIGTDKRPYRTSLPKLQCRKGDEPPVFKHPEGPAHKAIRQALGGARFGFYDSRRADGRMVLGTDSFRSDGKTSFWPNNYSSAKMAQKRIDKLSAAGIRCRLTGYNGGHIEFLGYTDSTRVALEKEREEYIAAYRKWQAAQQTHNDKKQVS